MQRRCQGVLIAVAFFLKRCNDFKYCNGENIKIKILLLLFMPIKCNQIRVIWCTTNPVKKLNFCDTFKQSKLSKRMSKDHGVRCACLFAVSMAPQLLKQSALF